MLTEKDYCDYETCVALEKLGFPIKQIAVGGQIPYKTVVYELPYEHPNWQYCKAYHPPLYYEAQKWLREEKDIIVYPEKNSFGWYYAIHYNVGKVHQLKYSEEYDTYEEALSEGLRTAIKILKEK